MTLATRLVRATFDRVARLASARGGNTSISSTEERPPLVISPSIEWDMPLFQRPQQLALAAAESGWSVIYTMPGETPRWIRPNLYVSDDLDAALARLKRAVLLVFSTTASALTVERIESLRSRALIVYDYIDEQRDEIYVVDEAKRRRHDTMLREADIVLVTADRLEEEVRAKRAADRPLVSAPNAVDLGHFDVRVPRERPDEMRRFARRPVIGYYGALASWVDYRLIDRLARERPQYDIVLIGIDYDRSLSRSGVLRRPNVYFLGPRPYERLPAYLACFDVATVPFLLNEITESTSPCKLFEYMAGGRPIVTTDLRECRKYRSVAIGHTPEEYISLIDRAVRAPGDPALQALLAGEARENSWAGRIEALAREVDRLTKGARA